MKTHLKIKIASLEAGRSIIAREAKKWNSPKTWGMHDSLVGHNEELKVEVRSALLAYGFLKGYPYSYLEVKTFYPPNWGKVEHNINRFGQDTVTDGQKIDLQAFQRTARIWLEDAKEYASPKRCVAHRLEKQKLGTKRRLNYKAKFWRPEPTDQAKLKADLKAKWETHLKLQNL